MPQRLLSVIVYPLREVRLRACVCVCVYIEYILTWCMASGVWASTCFYGTMGGIGGVVLSLDHLTALHQLHTYD